MILVLFSGALYVYYSFSATNDNIERIALTSAAGNSTQLLKTQQQINNTDSVYLTGIIVLSSCLAIALFCLYAFLHGIKCHERQNTGEKLFRLRANEDLGESDKKRSEFLANFIEEMHYPLNSLMAHSSLLLRTELAPSQKEYSVIMRRNAVSLLTIINNLISISKLEEGKLKQEMSSFVLKNVIEEAVSLITKDANGVVIGYDGALPVIVHGDAGMLRQVILNLVINMLRDSNEDHGLILNVSLQKNESNVSEIGFTLTGTATQENRGISAGKLSNSIAMSARLIALMGGYLKSENINGNSSIIFSIPVGKGENDLVSHSIEEYKRWGPVDTNLSKEIPLRILVVDDNEISQISLTSILLKMGYVCDVARLGKDGIAMAVEEKYDLIFMDIIMPDIDGMEASGSIRQFFMKKEWPVIVAVSPNIEYNTTKGEAAGINDFVMKPYIPKEVENIIRKWKSSFSL